MIQTSESTCETVEIENLLCYLQQIVLSSNQVECIFIVNANVGTKGLRPKLRFPHLRFCEKNQILCYAQRRRVVLVTLSLWVLNPLVHHVIDLNSLMVCIETHKRHCFIW